MLAGSSPVAATGAGDRGPGAVTRPLPNRAWERGGTQASPGVTAGAARGIAMTGQGQHQMTTRRFVFTVHKAASMLLVAVCRETARVLDVPHHSQNGQGDRLPREWSPDDHAILDGRAGVIGPLRLPLAPEALDGPIVVHLRDPRDVLVSLFYSVAYSHELAEMGRDGEQRERVRSGGVDAFCLERAEGFARRYRYYIEHFAGRPGVAFLTYETLVGHGREWARDFASAIGPDLDAATRAVLAERIAAVIEPDAPAPVEDRMNHLRQRTPGDHRRKLAPETILALDERLSDVLDGLGYPR